jgi:hypothetical protein
VNDKLIGKCGGMDYYVSSHTCDGNGNVIDINSNVWNGTTDITWYKESSTEFIITTAEQLAGLAVLVNGGKKFSGKTIKLGRNIVLNDTTNWQNWANNPPINNWIPIGNISSLFDATINTFDGIFDGNGFTVSGVYINNNSNPSQGLFGVIDNEVIIKKLGVTASYIKGVAYVGGLAGISGGKGGIISNSYFIGTVIGEMFVGGLVGVNGSSGGTISKSYSAGIVTGQMFVGGLVGINGSWEGDRGGGDGSRINNTYSTSTVSGQKFVGGLVGFNGALFGDATGSGMSGNTGNGSRISNSYYIGSVTGEENVGGLVGSNRSLRSTINSTYYNKEDGLSNIGGEGKTLDEMKRKETFKGWDFEKIWGIDNAINNGYPYILSGNRVLAANIPDTSVCNYSTIWNGRVDISWYSTSKSEFTITTAEAFAGLAVLVNGGNNFAGKTIKLGANITLNSTINWQSWAVSAPANVWTSIGTSTTQFSGTFDGSGYVISGVYMNYSVNSEQSFGLFGYVSSSGTIKNLWVTASYIKGKTQVGGLVGYSSGIIINSYFSGTVIGIEKVGGLVGSNISGSIKFSYSIGTVTGEHYVGGLAGHSSGIIISSYFSGTVTGLVSIGGLVGSNNIGSMIDSSYSLGTVKGKENVGGIVGFNISGKINFSYSEMMVTGTEYIGGFVGQNSIEGIISNSYSIGTVVGEHYVGGFIGQNFGTISYSYSIGIVAGVSFTGGFAGKLEKGKIVYCYYNKETSRQTDTGKGEGKTTAEMKLKATFVGWDFVKIWNINVVINNGYLYLRVFYPSADSCSGSSIWNGTVDTTWYANNKNASEFTICAAEQLAGFATLVNNGNNFAGKTVKLGANIMLNDTTNWKNWAGSTPSNSASSKTAAIAINDATKGTPRTWAAIGKPSSTFSGTFDGNGKIVSGLYINSTNNAQGLFGHINGAEIKNLGVIASYINVAKEGIWVGGLVGDNYGKVINCYYIGIVIGTQSVGGLVGSNPGTISNSYSGGEVSGTNMVGGLAGHNAGHESFKGTIINSYSIGTVKLSINGINGGGLVGSNTGIITSSYYDKDKSGQNDAGKGDSKTTVEMKKKETFVGWDFAKTWNVITTINSGYPYLYENSP